MTMIINYKIVTYISTALIYHFVVLGLEKKKTHKFRLERKFFKFIMCGIFNVEESTHLELPGTVELRVGNFSRVGSFLLPVEKC